MRSSTQKSARPAAPRLAAAAARFQRKSHLFSYTCKTFPLESNTCTPIKYKCFVCHTCKNKKLFFQGEWSRPSVQTQRPDPAVFPRHNHPFPRPDFDTWESTNLGCRFTPATPRQALEQPSGPHQSAPGLCRRPRQSPACRRPSRPPVWPQRPPACPPGCASRGPA